MKTYQDTIVPQLKKERGYRSNLEVPRLIKIVVNTGIGKKDEKEREQIQKHLELIVGQKVISRKARKSISTFKTRKGVVVGLSATLRGTRMYDFLERLVTIAIPRLRDFRGIDLNSVDTSGNLTIGFPEHMVFPEMIDEDLRTLFGFEVTLVTNAKSREEAKALLYALKIPFKK